MNPYKTIESEDERANHSGHHNTELKALIHVIGQSKQRE